MRSHQKQFGTWHTVYSGSVISKYKLMRNGDVVLGRFDTHGRPVSETFVTRLSPGDYDKFREIIDVYNASARSHSRVRVGRPTRRRRYSGTRPSSRPSSRSTSS